MNTDDKKVSKQSYWMSYTIERNGQLWNDGILVARFLNDPKNWESYEVLDASVVSTNEHSIEILVRMRTTEEQL